METLTRTPASQYLDGIIRMEDDYLRGRFIRRAIIDLLLCLTLTAGIAALLADRYPDLQQYLSPSVTGIIGAVALAALLIAMPTFYSLDARAAHRLEDVYKYIRTAYPDLYAYMLSLATQPVRSGV